MQKGVLKVGDRVVMIEDGYIAKKGDRGSLSSDDFSACPRFKWDKGIDSYEYLKNMKPQTLDDAKPSEWDAAFKATMADTFSTGTGAMKVSVTSVPATELHHSAVESPTHYNEGGIECIDYIRQQLGEEGFIAYCEGNVIKYQHRYKYKGGIEDLKKARKYQEWLLEALEAKSSVELETMLGRNR